MKVLFAGIPGVRKNVALENLSTLINSKSDRRVFMLQDSPVVRKVPVLDKLLYASNPISFFKRTESDQKGRWRKAFWSVTEQFEHAQTEHHFLGLHLTYRYNQIPSCIVDFKLLTDWKPDCIVTFIDDAYPTRQRIHD